MNRVCSIFSQLLQLFPRSEFQLAVKELEAERHARGFTCWSQFVAMMFCHLGQAKSLREICGGLAATEGKLKHLGVDQAPKRSTLAYANEHRPWRLYQRVFEQLLGRCEALSGPRRKFRFKNRLMSIDGTLIDLCCTMFDWAKFQRFKGAAKLHMVLDHDGCLPHFAVITEGKASEVKVARNAFHFDPGTIVVFDRGYVDYGWFQALTEQGVFFVTRMRHDAHYQVIEERELPQGRNILKDQVIKLGSHHYRKPGDYRRIEVKLDDGGSMVLLTNHLKFGSTTVARIYRERWQIEVFFRYLKQNLRIKTFVGTSPNAVHIQIWTALIGILVLKYLQMRASINWSIQGGSLLV